MTHIEGQFEPGDVHVETVAGRQDDPGLIRHQRRVVHLLTRQMHVVQHLQKAKQTRLSETNLWTMNTSNRTMAEDFNHTVSTKDCSKAALVLFKHCQCGARERDATTPKLSPIICESMDLRLDGWVTGIG